MRRSGKVTELQQIIRNLPRDKPRICQLIGQLIHNRHYAHCLTESLPMVLLTELVHARGCGSIASLRLRDVKTIALWFYIHPVRSWNKCITSICEPSLEGIAANKCRAALRQLKAGALAQLGIGNVYWQIMEGHIQSSAAKTKLAIMGPISVAPTKLISDSKLKKAKSHVGFGFQSVSDSHYQSTGMLRSAEMLKTRQCTSG